MIGYFVLDHLCIILYLMGMGASCRGAPHKTLVSFMQEVSFVTGNMFIYFVHHLELKHIIIRTP